MPKFNGQNRKKVDPRYFEEELLEERESMIRDLKRRQAWKDKQDAAMAQATGAAEKMAQGRQDFKANRAAATQQAVGRAAAAAAPTRAQRAAQSQLAAAEKSTAPVPQNRAQRAAQSQLAVAQSAAERASGPASGAEVTRPKLYKATDLFARARCKTCHYYFTAGTAEKPEGTWNIVDSRAGQKIKVATRRQVKQIERAVTSRLAEQLTTRKLKQIIREEIRRMLVKKK
jgi:hypothetical protein